MIRIRSKLVYQIPILITVVFLIECEQPSKDKVLKFYQALENGYFNEVVFLLNENPRLANTKDPYGAFPLHRASAMNWEEAVKLLIEKGADVNARIKGNQTPLHWAALNGATKVTKLLIDHGAELDVRNGEGRTPFDIAFTNFKKDTALLLLSSGAHLSPAVDKDFNPPLVWALQRKQWDWIEILLAHGADINFPSPSGYAPLHMVAMKGDKPIAELLISKGANINSKTYKWLETPLHLAAQSGNFEVAKVLIAHGAIIEAEDCNHFTALHRAAGGGNWEKVSEGHLKIVQLLIANGANVNAQSDHNYTPLHWASRRAGLSKEVIKLLIMKGAEINARDDQGKTPLRFALAFGRGEVADILRQHGGTE